MTENFPASGKDGYASLLSELKESSRAVDADAESQAADVAARFLAACARCEPGASNE